MHTSIQSERAAATSVAHAEPGSGKRPGAFLTAEWRNLVMLNYAIDPKLLSGIVPAGTELDAFKGETYVSLVGFEFNRTRLAGVAIPFHGSFEEVNLRFYVKRGAKRGVVFIRELVPKRAVAAVARWAFGENYSCVPMAHSVQAREGVIAAEYSWGRKDRRCALKIETAEPGSLPAEGSLSQFITEHYWGYAAQRGGGCLEYEVQHPRWNPREAKHASFQGDAASYYGNEFAAALGHEPDSAFLADGSTVTVFQGIKIV